ncbi:MAG TPA: 1,4-alpha-glucan branching protein GlgB [Acidimicrobiales bacterium]|nr:1,4-alpha-glucan branching protein GlgB [Acidimicrobiales bacterium]
MSPTKRAGVRWTDHDSYLFNEGTHRKLGERLGCAPLPTGGAEFAVWAPNATAVEVIGDFTGWSDGAALVSAASSGVWVGVIADAAIGDVYKYRITTRDGTSLERADPVAVKTEMPPRTGSVVWDLDYAWGDQAWLRTREGIAAHRAPISIYELHLGSWRRDPARPHELLRYGEIVDDLIEHVHRTGFTHVELLPVMEHPFYGSWGYQVTSYFAPTARYGSPQELMAFIDALHQAGIGVILDWVPSHFPHDAFALARFDGTALYEHADPRQGWHPDWDTFIFNYGRNEVRSFLVSSAEEWLGRYHADGLRVDAVASMLYLDYSRKAGEWIPNAVGGRENLDAVDFLRQLTTNAYADHPGITLIAEESTAWPGVSRQVDHGGLGFGFKWDMGWMHDTLEFIERDPIHRNWHFDELTKRGLWAFSENYVLALSHDEVTHGKGSLLAAMPGDDWQKFANLRLLLGYQWTQPGKKLLFMGQEFGQWGEWDHDRSLDWGLLAWEPHRGLLRWIEDLNITYRGEPAMYEGDTSPAGYRVVDLDAAIAVIGYERIADDGSTLLALCNFTPIARERTMRVSRPGRWTELLNSDAIEYGGSGVGNSGAVEASSSDDEAGEITAILPPLGCVVLRWDGA